MLSIPEKIILPFNNPLTAQLDIGGVWHVGMFVGCAAVLIGCIYKKKFLDITQNLPEKLLLSYVLIYALYLFEFPKIHFGIYNTAFQVTAAQSFVECLLILLGAKILHKLFFEFLYFFILFDLLAIWLKQDGLLVAPSFNAAFCALAIPFVPWWVVLSIIATVFTHHATTALMVIAAQTFAFAIKRKELRHWLFIIPPLFLGLIYWNHHLTFFDADERIQKYTQFMKFWSQDWKWILFGVGPGTFTWISLIQDEFKGNLFLSMHSDWLQIIWELGLMGFGLTCIVIFKTIQKVWNYPPLLAALFGCIAFGMSYHPLRWFPSAFLIACIFIACKNKESC